MFTKRYRKFSTWESKVLCLWYMERDIKTKGVLDRANQEMFDNM